VLDEEQLMMAQLFRRRTDLYPANLGSTAAGTARMSQLVAVGRTSTSGQNCCRAPV